MLTFFLSPAKPCFERKPQDLELILGKQAKFEAVVSGFPQPEVIWLKNNEPCGPSDRITLENRGNTKSLAIKQAIADDVGVYTIKASNEAGEDISSASLSVLCPPSMTDLGDQSIIVGNPIELKSAVKGVPKPMVSWKRNGTILTSDANTIIEELDDLHTIKKTNTVIEDEGKYALTVENKAGKIEKTSNVLIMIPPSFDKPLANQTFTENEELSLQVTVHGKPAPKLTWLKDNVEIKTNERMKISKDKDISTLLIKKVESSDSGQYKCIACNDAGKETSEALVLVNTRPQVLKKLKDTVISVGKALLMETEFKGAPEPEVKWFKDDEAIADDKTRKEDNRHHLQIEQVNLDNSGVYAAVASNVVGDCKTFANVKVIQAPWIVKPLEDSTLKEKQPLRLEAEIHGFPDPDVQWVKDGKTLSPKKSGTDRISLKKEGNVHTLLIVKASLEDQGIYSLTAKNPAGEVSCEASIMVQGIQQK